MMKGFYIFVADTADRTEGGVDDVTMVGEEIVTGDNANEASEI